MNKQRAEKKNENETKREEKKYINSSYQQTYRRCDEEYNGSRRPIPTFTRISYIFGNGFSFPLCIFFVVAVAAAALAVF